MVGGRVGFYELEKSEFVLFKAHFTLNKTHILQYNCRLCAFRALKKRKLNFFGHMYPKKLNEHLIYFNPPVVEIWWRWSFSTVRAPLRSIFVKAGFLPNACKRWKKKNVPNSFPPVSLSFNEILQVFDPTKFSNHFYQVPESRIFNQIWVNWC